MATPNYGFEKRQRELAKKRKKEEKAQRKAAGPGSTPETPDPDSGPDAEAVVPPAPDEGTPGRA